MKRFTKTASILAGIMAVIGVVFLILAFAIGLTPNRFMAMLKNGDFSFKIVDNAPIYVEDHEVQFDEIEEGIYNINLEFPAGYLEICYGDVRDIQIEHTNAAGLLWKHDEDTLDIRKEVVFEDNSDVSLKIILPKNTSYGEIHLEVGASQAKIEDLIAEEIHISVGMGQANIQNVQADIVSLEVGTGEMNVLDLAAEDLDIEAGIGQIDVEVYGEESDYDYTVECGIGSVKIGENSYSGLGAEYDSTHHNGDHHDAGCKMDIECGIGQVIVKFAGKEEI